MKYLVMTSPDSQGKSEVFFSAPMPEDLAPSDLIKRWGKLVENSPITVVSSQGKDNLGLDAIWDENSEKFSKPEEKVLRMSKPRESKTFSFLVNNEVTTILTLNGEEDGDEKFDIAFSEPVIVKSVEDDSPIDLGYIWDGTDFTPPEN
jgi:hypothetical protein